MAFCLSLATKTAFTSHSGKCTAAARATSPPSYVLHHEKVASKTLESNLKTCCRTWCTSYLMRITKNSIERSFQPFGLCAMLFLPGPGTDTILTGREKNRYCVSGRIRFPDFHHHFSANNEKIERRVPALNGCPCVCSYVGLKWLLWVVLNTERKYEVILT